MFKAVLRLLSMIFLSISTIMAVLDATRSIAAEALVMTPIGVSWSAVSPATLGQVQGLIVQNFPAFVWNPVASSVLNFPGFAIFAILAVLFALAGRRRLEKPNRFVAFR